MAQIGLMIEALFNQPKYLGARRMLRVGQDMRRVKV